MENKISLKKFERGKVSIIMPLYNMEKLVERAVMSVINQTYPNIEVIIVDDGSKDSSGLICDHIAMNDERVRVIHQENSGISGALRHAFEYVTGEYLLFVDADDYIVPHMIEVLVDAITVDNADIAQCDREYFYDPEHAPKTKGRAHKLNIKTLTSENEIMNDFFHEHNILKNIADKLFRSRLFDSVECQPGIQHIDVILMMQVIVKCKRYSIIDDVLYYVYKRPESISRGEYTDMHWNDLLFMNDYYQKSIVKNCPQYLDYMHYKWVKSAMIACQRMAKSKKVTDRKEKYDYCKLLAREHYRGAIASDYYKQEDVCTKLKCGLFNLSPVVFATISGNMHKIKSFLNRTAK